MLTINIRVAILFTLVFVLGACNLPSSSNATNNAQAVLTAAAQTVEANLTQSELFNPTAIPMQVTNTPSQVTPTLGSPATSIPPVATATQDCDDADFIADITIPDGTTLNKNESFTKTWRLKNTGTCSWTPSYVIAFSSGDSMSGPVTQALTGNVNPGQTVDLSINLKAPDSNGSYKGWWGLRNGTGVMFAQFYVDIKVSGGGGGGPFAVTSVNFTVTTWNDGSHTNCPKVVANITTNGDGNVTYKWTRSDNPITPTKSLDFASAGTQSVSYEWALGSGAPPNTYWVGLYIDNPNHQDFGHVNVTKCTVP